MLNWIVLYSDQHAPVRLSKRHASPYTKASWPKTNAVRCADQSLEAPRRAVQQEQYVGHCDPAGRRRCAVFIVWIVLDKTKFGYELKATRS